MKPVDSAPTDDPVVNLLLRGEAATLEEAEELYLDRALPELLTLLASPLSNTELEAHPLVQMYYRHGSRDWEDAL